MKDAQKIWISFPFDKTLGEILNDIARANNMSRQKLIQALCWDCIQEHLKMIKQIPSQSEGK